MAGYEVSLSKRRHSTAPAGAKMLDHRVATIKDVARLARVCITTVSRTFREPALVGEKTRARVLAAAASLHYHPNRTAAALASNRSGMIGLLLPGIENPFYYDIYAGVADVVQKRGYELLLKTTSFKSKRLLEAFHQIMSRRPAGVIVMGGSIPDSLLSQAMGMGIALATAPEIEYGTAVRSLLQYLSDLGHRKLGIVEHRTDFWDARISVLDDALTGFPQFEFRKVFDSDTLEGGRRACRELLADSPGMTALVCTHDIMALGAIRELHDRGYTVPADLSIAAMDNIKLGKFCVPPLTTIDFAPGTIAQILCASVFGEPQLPSIDCTLIVRNSTSAPARHSHPLQYSALET